MRNARASVRSGDPTVLEGTISIVAKRLLMVLSFTVISLLLVNMLDSSHHRKRARLLSSANRKRGTLAVPDDHHQSTLRAPSQPAVANTPPLLATSRLLVDPSSESPSDVPSDAPSDIPSDTPSTPPSTLSRTNQPSPSPTKRPTASPTSSIDLGLFLQYTSESDMKNPSTAQGKAIAWMNKEDAVYQSDQKTIQRYAILVMNFSLGANFAMSGVDECKWTGIRCSEAGMITKIAWANEKLSGSIPNEIEALKSLTYIDLGENRITGFLPDGLYTLTSLEHLFLHSNRLTGTISDKMQNLNNLIRFYAGENRLMGRFPTGLTSKGQGQAGSRPLRALSLYNNTFTGPLPSGSTLNLRSLWYLDLSHNKLSGTFPADWPTTMPKLESLYLSHNRISSELPENLFRIGNGRLMELLIDNNSLQGDVPGDFEYRRFLQALHVHGNPGLESLSKDICELFVFESGEMVSLRAECDICSCKELCDRWCK